MSLSQAFSVFWFKLRLVSLFYSSISKYANIFSRFDFIVIGWASDLHSTLPIASQSQKKNGLNWPNTNRALFKQHETLKFMQILKRKYKSSDPFLIEETTELITIFKAIEIGQKTHTYDELRPCTTSGVDPHYCRAPTTTTKITAAAAIQWARTLGFFFCSVGVKQIAAIAFAAIVEYQLDYSNSW